MLDYFNPDLYFSSDHSAVTLVHLVPVDHYDDFIKTLDSTQQGFLEENNFDITKEHSCIIPSATNGPACFEAIIKFDKDDYKALIKQLTSLPSFVKNLKLHAFNETLDTNLCAYLWAAHHYFFDRYKAKATPSPKLYVEELSPIVENQLRALYLGRNAVNTPAEDLTPMALQEVLENFAVEFKASCKTITGMELLDKKLNLIHAVGRGIIDNERQPRLIDFYYKCPENENAKTVTLVGKGVCFDTGGLNIKTGNSMGLMKKDMGGAATVLAVALNLLLQNPSFNLRVLIPAVENNVAGNSFRPSDIFKAYNGKTVEITNTDAEGRLILADALAYAAEDKPDLLINIATLTGAARVAVGPDLPVLYTNNDQLVPYFMNSKAYAYDPVWQLPLWKSYADDLKGTISDLINAPSGGMAGSITAALFLQNFIGDTKNWVHFDSYCHVPKPKPAQPKGGDVMPFTLLCDVINQFVKDQHA